MHRISSSAVWPSVGGERPHHCILSMLFYSLWLLQRQLAATRAGEEAVLDGRGHGGLVWKAPEVWREGPSRRPAEWQRYILATKSTSESRCWCTWDPHLSWQMSCCQSPIRPFDSLLLLPNFCDLYGQSLSDNGITATSHASAVTTYLRCIKSLVSCGRRKGLRT